MKRKLMLLLACLLASIGLVIAQTPKKVTGVVISEEDDQPVVGAFLGYVRFAARVPVRALEQRAQPDRVLRCHAAAGGAHAAGGRAAVLRFRGVLPPVPRRARAHRRGVLRAGVQGRVVGAVASGAWHVNPGVHERSHAAAFDV
mgnify:CR=1 FL=1